MEYEPSIYKDKLNRTFFYLGGLPAFIFLENGEKDYCCPDAACYYYEHKEECDLWIKNNKKV